MFVSQVNNCHTRKKPRSWTKELFDTITKMLINEIYENQQILKEAEICVHCGCRQSINNGAINNTWLVALLLCLFLGCFGAHRFYVGKTGSAIAMLLLTVLLGWLGIGVLITGIWAFIDLIIIIVGNFTTVNGEKIPMR